MTLLACVLLFASPAPHVCGAGCGVHEGRGLEPALASIVREAWQDTADPEVESDLKIGREAAAEVAKESKFSVNPAHTDRVQRIGREIAEIANRTVVRVTWGDPKLRRYPYEFHVIQGEDVNAFSLPGGFIYIYEGLIEFAQTDDELAGVIAHEIAHAAFRHVPKMIREQSKFDLLSLPLVLAAIFSRSEAAVGLSQGVGLANQAVASGWSLRAEESADYGGLQFLLASRYDPVGMLTFMERLAFRDRGKPVLDWGIYQTHPPSADRARALQARLREYNVEVRRSRVTTSLRSDVRPGEDGRVDLLFGATKVFSFGGSDALTRADLAAEQLDAFFDAVPALFEVDLIDGTRLIGRNALLFEAAADDGERYREEAAQALNTVKKLVFDLNYRLWPNHDRATRPG